MDKENWMRRHGFDIDSEQTYCIGGDDTFFIKDWLKQQGCKYDPILQWHSNKPLDVPCGYGMIGIQFNQVLEWSEDQEDAVFKNDAKVFMKEQLATLNDPNQSEFIGEIGKTLTDITAIYKGRHGYMGQYGWVNIYSFQYKHNILVWITNKQLAIQPDTIVNLKGRIKAHEVFRGLKTTRLNYVKINIIK